MKVQQYVLSDQNGLKDSSSEMGPFQMQTVTVDMNAGYVCEKEGNGDQPNPELLDRVEDNIRVRFALDNDNDNGPKGDSDSDDY